MPLFLDRPGGGGGMENEIVLLFFSFRQVCTCTYRISNQVSKVIFSSCRNFSWVYEIYKHSFVLGMPD